MKWHVSNMIWHHRIHEDNKTKSFSVLLMDSPSQAWCPSTQSSGCGGCRTGPAPNRPAQAGPLWRASWLSGADGSPEPASAQTAAHTEPFHRRTCPPGWTEEGRKHSAVLQWALSWKCPNTDPGTTAAAVGTQYLNSTQKWSKLLADSHLKSPFHSTKKRKQYVTLVHLLLLNSTMQIYQ